MSNSPLVSYTRLSPNRNSPRNHKIDTVTIHCVVGQCTVQALGSIFAPAERQGSSNYGIGYDGKIGMYVEEKDRSWCSSNSSNDHRAITIEVASDTKPPYAVTEKAYNALIDLLVDICQRNDIKRLLWKNDKSLIGQVDKQNMTMHRWFAATACPGDYLIDHYADIANKVNAKLEQQEKKETVVKKPATEEFKPYLVKIKIDNLRIRTGAGANTESKGFIRPGIYTIVQECTGPGATKWGKLKSCAGWISLDYCEKY